MDNDVEMMKILFDIGCDPNYNGTSMDYLDMWEYFDYDNDDYLYDEYYNDDEYEYEEIEFDYDDDNLYVDGITILHLACAEGAIGKISLKLLLQYYILNWLLLVMLYGRCSEASD